MEDIKHFIPSYYENESYKLDVFPKRESFASDAQYKAAVASVRSQIEKDQETFKIKLNVFAELLGKTFQCEICHRMFEPSWGAFHWPILPINIAGGKVAVPRTGATFCTLCGGSTQIPYPPTIIPENQVLLFHDEAYRKDNKHLIFSGVMCHKFFFNELNEMLSVFKRSIGLEGRLHMKDIWHEKKSEFPDFLKIVENFCRDIARAQHIKIFCTLQRTAVKPPKEKALKKDFRRKRFFRTVVMLLAHEIYMLTNAKAQPILIFDRDDENQKWLSEAFAALSCTLMFPFATNLVKVPAIKTIPGGENSGSEVADFVCYLLARYIDEKEDVNPSWLGEIIYVVEDQWGSRSVPRIGFPNDLYEVS